MIANQNADLRRATAEVVVRYRNKLGENGRPLSFARFAWELTQYTRARGIKVSYQAVKYWNDGKHSPDYLLVLHLQQTSPKDSWQYAFAREILAAYNRAVPEAN